ncbi:MAG: hypothetical protein ACJ77K_01200 [Bacteroidia bacterium]
MKILKGILIVMFLAAVSRLDAQEDYKEVTVSADYNFPLGKLAWVYKSSPGFHAGLNWCNEYSDGNTNKIGLGLGYFNFNPAADTLYYLVPPNGYGVAVYSKYKVASATFHAEKIKAFENKFCFILAGDAGIALVQYTSSHVDVGMDLGEESLEGKLILAPQIGMGYQLSENMSLAFATQYNALISLGSQDANSTDYNSNAGTARQFFSAYLKFGYSF